MFLLRKEVNRMLTPQSRTEFTNARQRAFIAEWLNFFTGRPNDLLSFDEVRDRLRLQDSAYKGLQEIELDKIVGSTGRYRDFNRAFLPKNDQTEQRWRIISQVASDGQGYPPIEVFQVGDVYFVRDGNHRVSVAKANKAKTIEAYVVEYKTSVPVNKDDNLDSILLKYERANFFEETRLDQIRPEQEVHFTEPGRYPLVKEHIGFHKYLRETECGCEIPDEEAVASWYDSVYRPIVELIRQKEVLKQFPERSEADLYAWLLLHRAELEDKLHTLGHIPDEALLAEVTREKSGNPFVRLMGLFHRNLGLEDLPLRVERARFLEMTGLDELRPDHGIECTEPGCYQVINEHIAGHKYLREVESSRELTYEEAVASWYDNVYLPVVRLIREKEVLDHFPDNSESDLYVWIVSRRADLERNQPAMEQTLNERIIEDLEQECRSNSIVHLAQHFLQQFNRHTMTVVS
jgi:hypothetical protein